MPILEVFYDYACPYCLRAHPLLLKALETAPAIEVIWRPCEAHPRPDPYGPHSDLCIQAFLFAQATGADLLAVHQRLYDAALTTRINIESIGALAAFMAPLLDETGLIRALRSGTYRGAQQQNNRYAFEKNGVWAVPAYRIEGHLLDAVEDIGVTEAQIHTLLQKATGQA